jgi:hypothetical protein
MNRPSADEYAPSILNSISREEGTKKIKESDPDKY